MLRSLPPACKPKTDDGGPTAMRHPSLLTNDDDVAAAGSGGLVEKVIVERLTSVAGGAAVEDVAADDEQVDLLIVQLHTQPVEKSGLFGQTAATVEAAAQVPVRCVEEAE